MHEMLRYRLALVLVCFAGGVVVVLLQRNDFHMQTRTTQYGTLFVASSRTARRSGTSSASTQLPLPPLERPPLPLLRRTLRTTLAAVALASNVSTERLDATAHAMQWLISSPRGALHVVSAHAFTVSSAASAAPQLRWVALIAETSVPTRELQRGHCIFSADAVHVPIVVLESSERTEGSPFRSVVLRCAAASLPSDAWASGELSLVVGGERVDGVRFHGNAPLASMSGRPQQPLQPQRAARVVACVPPIHRFGDAAGAIDALALIEWIEYHRISGVERIDVYVDEVPAAFAAVLSAYTAGGGRGVGSSSSSGATARASSTQRRLNVQLYAFRSAAQWGHGFNRIPYGNNNLQLLAKHDCLYRHKALGTSQWLWMGDLDEFLFMPPQRAAAMDRAASAAGSTVGWTPQLREWARGAMHHRRGGVALKVGSVTFGNYFFPQYCLSPRAAASELRLLQRVVRRAQFWDQGEGGCWLRSCRGKAIVRPSAVALLHNHRVERFEDGPYGELKASAGVAHVKHLRDSGGSSGSSRCRVLGGRTLSELDAERSAARWASRWPDRWWHWHGTINSGALMFDTQVADSMRPELERNVARTVAALASSNYRVQ